MYKVLLADDNALSRKAVRQSVSWKNNGCKIVGEAENGVKACQMIRELRPDIVLMDIRMPGMTGLEAIRCLKGEGIDSLYILITAYDDFAFAKEGIQLGVFDYILKPVAEKELQRVIQKAVDDLTQEIQDGEKEKRRRLLNESICGNTSAMEELQCACERVWGRFQDYCIILVSSETGMDDTLLQEIQKSCELRLPVRLLWTRNKEGTVFLCSFQELQMIKEYYLISLKVAEQIQGWLQKREIAAVISISEVAKKTADIPFLYEHAVFARNSRFFLENQKVIHYESLRSRSIRNENEYEYEMMEELEAFYLSCKGQSEKIEENLRRFLQCMEKNGNYDARYVKDILIQVGIMMTCQVREKDMGRFSKNADQIIKELNECKTAREAYAWLQEYAAQLAGSSSSAARLSAPARRILEYMNQHFQEHLSLQDVSDALDISSSHICRVLKNETGETFVTLLNKIRIQEAGRLLREGKWKVYEVAEKCGFSNYAYFYQLFKKETGISPTEWK